MKKILFYLTLVWAIFSLNISDAHHMGPEWGFNITQLSYAVDYCQLNQENIFIDDCLGDISNDDTNDSERKKLSSRTTACSNTSSFAQNFSDDTFKNILPTKLFFPFKTSILIFICVFRL
jgi:hypothetical protein